jgi:hypothetical protein
MKFKILILFLIINLSLIFNTIAETNINTYSTILRLNPRVNKTFAKKVSREINKYSKRYGLDPYLMVAIITQESRFNMGAKNCTVGLNGRQEEDRICYDFGLIQLNYTNIKNMEIDLDRLMIDSNYAVEIMAKMIHDNKRRYGKKESRTYWTRYNASNKFQRFLYQRLVCRYYVGNNYCTGMKTFDWEAD